MAVDIRSILSQARDKVAAALLEQSAAPQVRSAASGTGGSVAFGTLTETLADLNAIEQAYNERQYDAGIRMLAVGFDRRPI